MGVLLVALLPPKSVPLVKTAKISEGINALHLHSIHLSVTPPRNSLDAVARVRTHGFHFKR